MKTFLLQHIVCGTCGLAYKQAIGKTVDGEKVLTPTITDRCPRCHQTPKTDDVVAQTEHTYSG